MTVVVVTPPEPIVSLEEMERHLADLPDEDQQYVELLISAATAWIDGPAGWLGRAIGKQTLEYRSDCWPAELPYRPAIDIVTVTVGGVTVEDVTVRPDGRLSYPHGLGSGEVVIQYRAGYEKAPDPVRVAVMMLVAQWYNTRENVITRTITSEMPFAVDALLQPYRVYR